MIDVQWQLMTVFTKDNAIDLASEYRPVGVCERWTYVFYKK